MIEHYTLLFIGMVLGVLALLTLRGRLGWVRLLALMVLWGVAADSHAGGLVRAWWVAVGWISQTDPFRYGGPAWQTQRADWLPIIIQSLTAAGLLTMAWKGGRKRA